METKRKTEASQWCCVVETHHQCKTEAIIILQNVKLIRCLAAKISHPTMCVLGCLLLVYFYNRTFGQKAALSDLFRLFVVTLPPLSLQPFYALVVRLPCRCRAAAQIAPEHMVGFPNYSTGGTIGAILCCAPALVGHYYEAETTGSEVRGGPLSSASSTATDATAGVVLTVKFVHRRPGLTWCGVVRPGSGNKTFFWCD